MYLKTKAANRRELSSQSGKQSTDFSVLPGKSKGMKQHMAVSLKKKKKKSLLGL